MNIRAKIEEHRSECVEEIEGMNPFDAAYELFQMGDTVGSSEYLGYYASLLSRGSDIWRMSGVGVARAVVKEIDGTVTPTVTFIQEIKVSTIDSIVEEIQRALKASERLK